jgi:SAM-dependent methyltransferase
MTAIQASGYVFDHAWTEERTRLGGLEAAFDPGTRDLLERLGAGPGRRCLEVGAGGGTVACWLADRVVPGGSVVATDVETGFLDAQVQHHPALEVLRHDLATDDLPGGFDLVHARWLVHWLPDRALALRRMVGALRPGGVLLVEEPDFVTAFGACEPPALRRVLTACIRHLEGTSPGDAEYGRRLLDDLTAAGVVEVAAEGRCPLVRGGSPPAAHFLRLTLEKVRQPLVAGGMVTGAEIVEAVAALDDPAVTVVMPLTVAAWGRRPG